MDTSASENAATDSAEMTDPTPTTPTPTPKEVRKTLECPICFEM